MSANKSCNSTTETETEESSAQRNVANSVLSDLSSFKFEKVLSNNTNRKTICLQGSFESIVGSGIIILEKTAFEEVDFGEGSEYFGASTGYLKKLFQNDIYGNYEYFPKVELNGKYD